LLPPQAVTSSIKAIAIIINIRIFERFLGVTDILFLLILETVNDKYGKTFFRFRAKRRSESGTLQTV
jgi:hypothetical protein